MRLWVLIDKFQVNILQLAVCFLKSVSKRLFLNMNLCFWIFERLLFLKILAMNDGKEKS